LKGTLVSVIGPDGVGKTTQAKLLQSSLRTKGISAEYIWIRWNHRLSLPVLGLSKVLKLSDSERLSSGKKVVYHYFNKIRPVAAVYQFTFLIDTILAFILKIYPKLWLGKFVISDRSVYDAFVDLSLSTRSPKLIDSFIGRVFLSFSRGTTIMLTANSSVLKARREDVRIDRDIDQKLYLYNILSRRYGIIQIDTEKSISEVTLAILGIVISQ
jgi:hypothetical protein